MVLDQIGVKPISIHSDYEKSILNAACRTLGCKIFGCWFHLCQSWLKIQTLGIEFIIYIMLTVYIICNILYSGLMTTYYSSEPFRESFRLVQALPFLPCDQVIDGFMSIKEEAPIKMKPFFEYVDANYVGSKKKPRFEIDRQLEFV